MLEPAETELVAVPNYDCWAIMPESVWGDIRDQSDVVLNIAHCATWGEFRSVDVRDERMVDLVYELNGVEPGTEPPDDAPFNAELHQFDEFDGNQLLGKATADLFATIMDQSFPWECVQTSEHWATIDQKDIVTVTQALQERGFIVRRVGV